MEFTQNLREERLKQHFNPEDLKDIEKYLRNLDLTLDEEKRRLKNRFETYKKFLEYQRKIRNPLNVRQLIAVHATNYFPKGGVIRTTGNFLNDGRETIHFALNGYVSSHSKGSFDKRKFVILIPLKEIIDRVVGMIPADTFVFGNLTLPSGSEIIINQQLVPEVYYDKGILKYQKMAGKANICISKKNETIEEATKRRIRERRYTVMYIRERNWGSPEDEDEEKRIKRLFRGKSVTTYDVAKKLHIDAKEHFRTVYSVIENISWFTKDFIKEKINSKNVEIEDIIKLKVAIISAFHKLQKLRKKSKIAISEEDMATYLKIMKHLKNLYKLLKKEFPDKKIWKRGKDEKISFGYSIYDKPF